MKSITKRICRLIGGLSLLACFATVWAVSVPAQPIFEPVTTRCAQLNALSTVRSRVNWLQGSTRTASNFGEQGYGSVWRSLQELRMAYAALTQTLTPQQSAHGANDLAELSAGLDIIEEAFANYQEEVAGGRPATATLAKLCRVVSQGSTLWLEQMNKTSSRIKIG